MKVSFGALSLPKSGALAVPVARDRKLLASAKQLDKATGGALVRALAVSRFNGRTGEILEALAPSQLKNSRVLLYGVGEPKDLKDLDWETIGAKLLGRLNGAGEGVAAVMVEAGDEAAARIAYGALLEGYRFDRYRTKEEADKKPSLTKLSVLVEGPAAARKRYRGLEQVAGGVFLTRDLVSEPANVIYPVSFVDRVKKLKELGVKVQVLGEKEMSRLGMGALLGVGQGSARESQLLVLQWQGAPGAKTKAPLAVVGKGVTFDTGGISIKPAAGMEEMKWDMGGAGTVAGLMQALAARKAKANVVGICGLVENMPSSTAQRPGDVVTSMSGQTIEVINTDAEGRLVLADALTYVQQKFKPRAIIDLATLTGAIIIALGHEYAGLFTNDDTLAEQLSAAGSAVGEKLWRLPLHEAYDKAINCDVADMKNTSSRAGSSITAAQFLQRFIKEGTPWAHLDIAGVAWASKERPTVPKGGSGFGVRLLDRLVAEHYEG